MSNEFTPEEVAKFRKFLFEEIYTALEKAAPEELIGGSFIILGAVESEDKLMFSQCVVHSEAAHEALEIARDAEGEEFREALAAIPLSANVMQGAANHTGDLLEGSAEQAKAIYAIAQRLSF